MKQILSTTLAINTNWCNLYRIFYDLLTSIPSQNKNKSQYACILRIFFSLQKTRRSYCSLKLLSMCSCCLPFATAKTYTHFTKWQIWILRHSASNWSYPDMICPMSLHLSMLIIQSFLTPLARWHKVFHCSSKDSTNLSVKLRIWLTCMLNILAMFCSSIWSKNGSQSYCLSFNMYSPSLAQFHVSSDW
jgi:hypothetical protein